MPTYKEQYEKIIQAYFKDEIKPYSGKFCVCGTLANGSHWKDAPYSGKEMRRIEAALLITLRRETIGIKTPIVMTKCIIYGDAEAYHECRQEGNDNRNFTGTQHQIENHPNYEEALFEGMCSALDVLKDIHEKRGENVDVIETQFVKRKLETV